MARVRLLSIQKSVVCGALSSHSMLSDFRCYLTVYNEALKN